MQQEKCLEELPKYSKKDWKLGRKRLLVHCNPISKRTIILFHNDYISMRNDSVVVHSGNALIQPKVLQASNLSKDVMKYTALINAFGEAHLFDGDFFG